MSRTTSPIQLNDELSGDRSMDEFILTNDLSTKVLANKSKFPREAQLFQNTTGRINIARSRLPKVSDVFSMVSPVEATSINSI